MEKIEIDTKGWGRWYEVEEFAEVKGISISEAIERLIEKGLDA